MATIDWIIVGGYLLGLVYFGWSDRGSLRGSASKIILGGRFLTLPAFVATLVTTWYGGILGVGEYTYRFGISNWFVFGLPYYLGAGAFAVFLAKRARKSEALTIPQRIQSAFGPRSSFLSAVLIFITTAPAAYLLILGILIQFFFGAQLWVGILLSALFSLFYVFLGGFRAVVRTDKLQFAFMFFGFFCLLAFLINDHGLWGFLSAALPETHTSFTGGQSMAYMAAWYVIAQGALVEPGFHQRCYAAKDESTARKGIVLSIGFWALFDFMTTLCGLYAFALLPDLADPVMAFPALALLTLPPAILGIFVTGLLSVVMSTIDSNSFIAATTYSHDIMAKLRKQTHRDTLRKDTIVGLVLSTIIALLISLVFDSVIDIWREIGSILAPALLIPVLLAFCGDKITRKNFSDREILAIMITGGGISLLWILYAHLIPGGVYPFAQYPFISEPIFPGLYSSIALYLALHLRQPRQPHLK